MPSTITNTHRQHNAIFITKAYYILFILIKTKYKTSNLISTRQCSCTELDRIDQINISCFIVFSLLENKQSISGHKSEFSDTVNLFFQRIYKYSSLAVMERHLTWLLLNKQLTIPKLSCTFTKIKKCSTYV